MSVLIDNRQEEIIIDIKMEAFVERVVNEVLKVEEIEDDYEISISFVNNKEIAELNQVYRGINCATDVLSFPMMDFDDFELEGILEEDEEYIEEELPLGDIVISLEKAREQATKYEHSLNREIAFLLIHGMLHLLGHDHESEAEEKEMFLRQDEILQNLNISR